MGREDFIPFLEVGSEELVEQTYRTTGVHYHFEGKLDKKFLTRKANGSPPLNAARNTAESSNSITLKTSLDDRRGS